MKDRLTKLRSFIYEAILYEMTSAEDYNAWKGYYDIDPENPMPIQDVIDGWVLYGLKARESGTFHGKYDPQDLMPFREYEWSRESAAGKEVFGSKGTAYTDKWFDIPDIDDNVGIDKWDSMVTRLKKGWKENDPAYFEIGKNGVAKVGEGNHRLAIANKIGIKVPVMFKFKDSVFIDPASNVR